MGPSVAELRRQGIDYRGVLYAGCMLTEDGPKLIEYNVRFGDPEAEVVLPRLAGDVANLLRRGGRTVVLISTPQIISDAAVCVAGVRRRAIRAPRTGDRIHGVAEAGTVEGVTIFHAGGTRWQMRRVNYCEAPGAGPCRQRAWRVD